MHDPLFSLEDLFLRYLDMHGLQNAYDEQRIVQAWKELNIPLLDTHTYQLRYERGTLYVQLSSPLLRHTLHEQRKNLLARLNATLPGAPLQKLILR